MRIRPKVILRYLMESLGDKSLCLACGTPSHLPLCKKCREKLLAIDFSEARCCKCGRKLLSEIKICRECRENTEETYIDSCFPLFLYANWKKNLLSKWKIQGDLILTSLFADCIAKVIQAKGWENIPIVPVPPRPFKFYTVGYDQIDSLANALHFTYRFKICKVLKRISQTEQKTLSLKERIENTQKGYVLKKRLNSNSAILIDDIITTGATTRACAKLLKDSGVKTVYCISLFSAS